MTAPASNGGVRPWYREFWPWALMLPPLLSVIGGVAMVLMATHTSRALVVDDYARIEELTAERFARDRRAVSLRLAARLRVGVESGHLELRLAAPPDFRGPEALVLGLRHATDPAADREVRLLRDSHGDAEGDVYAADVAFAPGRYGVELMPEDRSWRLSAPVHRLQGEIALTAQAAGP
jgi:hypothetical protein